MPSSRTGTVAFRLPNADLKLIDQAIEANPSLSRTKLCRIALTRFLRSEEFLRLQDNQALKRA